MHDTAPCTAHKLSAHFLSLPKALNANLNNVIILVLCVEIQIALTFFDVFHKLNTIHIKISFVLYNRPCTAYKSPN